MIYVKNKHNARLSAVKKEVVKSFGRGNPISWRNKDFEDLSFAIHLKTRIRISPATLKRIFGKNKTPDRYYPQETTIEALEEYAQVLPKTPKPGSTSNRFRKIIYYALIPVFITLIAQLVLRLNTTTDQLAEGAHLELSKIDGANPATVYFNYQIPKLKDSVYLSLGDGTPDEAIEANKNKKSHYYRYPGLFHASLKTKTRTISDTVSLFIPTKNWQALAYYYEEDENERYFPIPLNMATWEGVFHPTGRNLSSIGMDTTKILVVRLDNFRKTSTSGDSFRLKTRIKNVSYWPAIRCYSAYIRIYGENNSIQFKLTNKGCSQFGELKLSEKTALGSYHDLTNFSVDIKNWNEIEILNQNKQTSFHVNSKQIFAENYNESLGNIVGVSLLFHGSGYVEYFELYDAQKNLIFEKDF
ncbi:hypothetical protein [Sunxiuqinia sp. sy24]|uniref:hypothetical protein n=1 Tax=Sunxiuqinia sp. sy24 TaxID=3461495 RepID=UPI004045858C